MIAPQNLETLIQNLQTGSANTQWSGANFESLRKLAKQFPDRRGRFAVHHFGVMYASQREAQGGLGSLGLKVPKDENKDVKLIGPSGPKRWNVLYIPEPRLLPVVACHQDPSYFAIGWTDGAKVAHWFLDLVVEDGYRVSPGTEQFKTLPTGFPDRQPLPTWRMTDGLSTVFFRQRWAATPPSKWPISLGTVK